MYIASAIRIHLKTKKQIDNYFALNVKIMDQYIVDGRFYLIVDMSNLIIEPELTDIYAKHAGAICEKYIFPDGVARYGFEITRVTVRRGHEEYLNKDPNIFNSRQDAYVYINSLIEQKQQQAGTSNKPITA